MTDSHASGWPKVWRDNLGLCYALLRDGAPERSCLYAMVSLDGMICREYQYVPAPDGGMVGFNWEDGDDIVVPPEPLDIA